MSARLTKTRKKLRKSDEAGAAAAALRRGASKEGEGDQSGVEINLEMVIASELVQRK